jgi:hypothetical protein
MAGVGELVQRIGDGQAHVRYMVVGRSRGRVTLCVICTVHKKMRSVGFLTWSQNQERRCVSGLTSKPPGRVSQFGPQNRQLRFNNFVIKISTTVSCFVPQNQVRYSLSVASQNRREDKNGASHMLRSNGLFCLKASWARGSQSDLKIDEGAVRMVHVTLLRRLRRVEAKDR